MMPRRTKTRSGLPLKQTVLIDLRGTLFRLPIGYLNAWPGKYNVYDLKGVNKKSVLYFTFWMPDLRYPDIERVGKPWYRPQEPGRPKPGPGQYIVKVHLHRPFLPDDPGDITPLQKFKNYTRNIGGPAAQDAFSYDEEYGLQRFWLSAKAKADQAVLYRHIGGTQPQVFLSCGSSEIEQKTAPNPLCHRNVYFESEGLGFYLRFSLVDLPNWCEIVMAARTLLLQWRVKR